MVNITPAAVVVTLLWFLTWMVVVTVGVWLIRHVIRFVVDEWTTVARAMRRFFHTP